MSARKPGEPEPAPRVPLPSSAVSLAGSAVGLATALLFGETLSRLLPAASQLPGFASLHGLDVRRETARYLLVLILPIVGGFAARALRRRRPPDAAGLDTPVSASARNGGSSRSHRLWVAAVCAHGLTTWIFAVAAFPEVALRSPTLLLGAAVAVSFGFALLLGNGNIERGAPFLAAAAGVLPLAFLGQRPIPLAAAAAAGTFALPAITRALAGRRPVVEKLLRVATLTILVPGSVTAAAAAPTMGLPPIADLFENGHELLPASQYLRGERPYRDVVPGHGVLSDGGLDAVSMLVFGESYRGYMRGRKILGAAFWPAIYAVGLCATGSPTVGLGVALLSLATFFQYAFVRAIPSLAALAIALAASRTGDRRLWIGAGAALVLCVFVSVDFAIYAAASAAAALWVSRGDRSAALGALARGGLAAGGVGAAALLALGVIPEFARVTFRLVPSLLPVYAQGFPPALPLGGGMAAMLYAAAGVGVLLLGALLPRGKGVSEAARPLPPVAAWISLAMLAVLERHHLNYPYLAVPALVVLLARWIREAAADRLLGSLAAGTVVAGFALVHGAQGLPVAVGAAIPGRPLAPGLEPLAAPLRADGAVFLAHDRALVARTAEMMRRAGFQDGDTWLDFANEPGLYFLFDRPCPIRYYEVPFYESESAQREVIAAVERNPRVRAVLLSGTSPLIDGVPNETRAPLVARYIRETFRPFLREDGIEFWIRRDAADTGPRREAPRP